MELFNDMEDVEEWLEPLDYEGFWKETAVFQLTEIEPRASCDRQIADSSVDKETVLYVLKGMARLELVRRYALKTREIVPLYPYH